MIQHGDEKAPRFDPSETATGPLSLVLQAGRSYVVVETSGPELEAFTVWEDGSFTRWVPEDAAPERIPPRTGPSVGGLQLRRD